MVKFKRLTRPGVLISVAGHVAALMLSLLFVGANSHEAIPPEAMVVDIVPPDQVPRLQGTPSDRMTSGSDVPLNGPNSAPAQPIPPMAPSPPKAAAQPQQPQQHSQQAQQQSESQRSASQVTAPPQGPHADLTFAETVKDEIEEIKAAESSPDQAQQHPQETPDQPGAAETIARYAIAGGALGGGFNAPPIDTNKAGYDFTAAFRERVSACSSLPAGIWPDDRVSVTLRIFFNRDGTLASPPKALQPIASEKQQALMENSISALERCQPYTMLPADQYKQWKKLDLTFFPMNAPIP